MFIDAMLCSVASVCWMLISNGKDNDEWDFFVILADLNEGCLWCLKSVIGSPVLLMDWQRDMCTGQNEWVPVCSAQFY